MYNTSPAANAIAVTPSALGNILGGSLGSRCFAVMQERSFRGYQSTRRFRTPTKLRYEQRVDTLQHGHIMRYAGAKYGTLARLIRIRKHRSPHKTSSPGGSARIAPLPPRIAVGATCQNAHRSEGVAQALSEVKPRCRVGRSDVHWCRRVTRAALAVCQITITACNCRPGCLKLGRLQYTTIMIIFIT